jgi:hypothetical protein
MIGGDLSKYLVILQGGIDLTKRTLIIAQHSSETDKLINVKPLPALVQSH